MKLIQIWGGFITRDVPHYLMWNQIEGIPDVTTDERAAWRFRDSEAASCGVECMNYFIKEGKGMGYDKFGYSLSLEYVDAPEKGLIPEQSIW